jgi:hypothetical protein
MNNAKPRMKIFYLVCILIASLFSLGWFREWSIMLEIRYLSVSQTDYDEYIIMENIN